MMGYITISGSLGCIVGPLLLAKVYSEEGPRITFIVFYLFCLLQCSHSSGLLQKSTLLCISVKITISQFK